MFIRFQDLFYHLNLRELKFKLFFVKVVGNLGAVDHRGGSITHLKNIFLTACNRNVVLSLQELMLIDVVRAYFDHLFLESDQVIDAFEVEDGGSHLVQDSNLFELVVNYNPILLVDQLRVHLHFVVEHVLLAVILL